MELTPLQLEIQKLWADKSLNFGCIIEAKFISWSLWYYTICELWDYVYWVVQTWINKWFERVYLESESILDTKYEIIWHPITYSRLSYLRSTNQPLSIPSWATRNAILVSFQNNPELYNQSILERPEELQLLVRDFLLSIQ